MAAVITVVTVFVTLYMYATRITTVVKEYKIYILVHITVVS